MNNQTQEKAPRDPDTSRAATKRTAMPAALGFRLIAEALTGLRGFLLLPFVAGRLGASSYGTFSQIWLASGLLAPLLSLSLEHAIVRDIAAEPSGPKAAKRVWSALAMTASLSLVLGGLSLGPLATLLGGLILGKGTWKVEIVAVTVLAAFAAAVTIGQSVLQAAGRIAEVSIFHMSRTLATTGLMIFTARYTTVPWKIALSALLAEFLSLIYLLAWIWRNVGPPMVSPREMPPMLAFCLPITGSNTVYSWTNAIPRLFLVQVAGREAIGIYSAALSLTAPVGQIASSIQYVLYPEVAQRWRDGDRRGGESLAARGRLAIVTLGLLMTLILAVVGPQLLRTLTGGTIAPPGEVIGVAAGAAVLAGSYRIGALPLLSAGRSGFYLAALTISCAICLLASAVLVPQATLLGAVTAQLIAAFSLLPALSLLLRMSGDVVAQEDSRARRSLRGEMAVWATLVLGLVGMSFVISLRAVWALVALQSLWLAMQRRSAKANALKPCANNTKTDQNEGKNQASVNVQCKS